MRVQPGVQGWMRTFPVGFEEVWLIDRRQERDQRLRDRQNEVGESRFRRRKLWLRRVCPMRRQERSVSWYRVREVDGSRDGALGFS